MGEYHKRESLIIIKKHNSALTATTEKFKTGQHLGKKVIMRGSSTGRKREREKYLLGVPEPETGRCGGGCSI